MIAIQKTKAEDVNSQCVPNLLPCRIHQNGPANASPRYWNPQEGGRPEAYFRGRKLKGREVKIPNGYKGIVVKESAKSQHENGAPERLAVNDGDVEESRQMFETDVLHEVADFEDVVIWAHETCTEPEDVFVKALDEWVTFAASINAPTSLSTDLSNDTGA